jgi:hypothetical protein
MTTNFLLLRGTHALCLSSKARTTSSLTQIKERYKQTASKNCFPVYRKIGLALRTKRKIMGQKMVNFKNVSISTPPLQNEA